MPAGRGRWLSVPSPRNVLVDTHCHLGDPAFDADRPAVLQRARAAGVGHVVVVAESVGSSERAAAMAEADPCLSATAGVHPHEASTWSAQTADRVRDLLRGPGVVAVGETGLDYHYDNSPRPKQRAAFAAQLALGHELTKPVVIHARDAESEVAKIVRDAPAGVVCVLHSFAGGDTLFAAALECGAYVSFSGMVTFKSWAGDGWIRDVPRDRLLVETDGPYLAPVPHRGHRNEPAFVAHVARRLADVCGMSLEALAAQTTANALRCFGSRVAAKDVAHS